MNPGLVVKLRPAGPWRIGSDSGARNRVDSLYHSDSLYSAVAWAMARLGSLEDWLEATARAEAPAVCFSSCFPFMDEIDYVIPPRTLWPPAPPAASARLRWKSARFVPLEIVRAILERRRIDDSQWAVDGPSECLIPAGRPGPFRTAVRWSAAVDRLTGAAERHSAACIEFRPGAGLWTVASFLDESARDRWSGPVKAAFLLLADSGFGGERSRGWGRSETPEFTETSLPDLILPNGRKTEPEVVVRQVEPASAASAAPESPAEQTAGESPAGSEAAIPEAGIESPADIEPLAAEVESVDPASSSETVSAEPETAETPAPEATALDLAVSPEATPASAPGGEERARPHWLLALYSPAGADRIDWARGSYALLTRGGRIDSPAGYGDLKKNVQMVAEGSVLLCASAPRGSAPDVAPDGFAHPVYRAGFGVAIPLPEVS